MKIVNIEYNLHINLDENTVQVLYVENASAFTKMVGDLVCQKNGVSGSWILSEADEDISISKKMEVIINPFAVDCNDKRILKALYQEMKEDTIENCNGLYAEINANNLNFIEQIISRQSYMLDYDCQFSVEDILKIYNLRFEVDNVSLLTYLTEYIKIWHRVGNVDCFAFVNLKSYLTEEEIGLLYEMIFYEKVFLILIENKEYNHLDVENVVILDEDLCIITFKK